VGHCLEHRHSKWLKGLLYKVLAFYILLVYGSFLRDGAIAPESDSTSTRFIVRIPCPSVAPHLAVPSGKVVNALPEN